MKNAQKAQAILAKHAEGWRFHIGWPYLHEPQPEPKPTHGGGGKRVTEKTGAALRLTGQQWAERKAQLTRVPHRKK